MIHNSFYSLLIFLSSVLVINNQYKQEHKNGEIVLIFNKNPLANQRRNGPYTPNQARYYTNNLIRAEMEINNKTKIDTLKIRTTRENLPVDIFHNYVVFSYHFKQGDTVTFSFADDIPFVAKINRDTKAFDLNYSLLFKKRFNEPLVGSNLIKLEAAPPKDKQFSNLYTNYEIRKKFIDSLKNANLLSINLYQLYTSQNECRFLWDPIFNDRLKPFSDGIQQQFPTSAIINNSALLYNDFFHQFLQWRYLMSDALGVPKIKSAQSISMDYKIAYEKIKINVKNEEVKDYLLFSCLQKINELDSKSNFSIYLNKFKDDVKDKRFDDYIKYNFDDFLMDNSGSTLLTNLVKTKKTEFSTLIKSLKGNVIYIDLWASWCAPCRAAMPASKQLKTTFAGKPVKFLYFSIDAKFSDWVKASNEEKLTNDPYSLLMLDSRNAALTKQFNITTIPRYLIYDKKGLLIYQNAPGPTAADIRSILNKYIAEK